MPFGICSYFVSAIAQSKAINSSDRLLSHLRERRQNVIDGETRGYDHVLESRKLSIAHFSNLT